MWRSQVPPEMVGVHPGNRCGLGVGGAESHQHGAQILSAGFSTRKAADATAIEVGEWNRDGGVAFNKSLSDISKEYIPPLSDCRLLSIGGSHTNTFLRAVKSGATSAVAALADEHGKLNFEALSLNRKSFKEACVSGLTWNILQSRNRVPCPGGLRASRAQYARGGDANGVGGHA